MSVDRFNEQIWHYLVLFKLQRPSDYGVKGCLIDSEIGTKLSKAKVREGTRGLEAERELNIVQRECNEIYNVIEDHLLRKNCRSYNQALQISNALSCMCLCGS